MAGHEQFMLDKLTHYMCWACWKDIVGNAEAGIRSGTPTNDHCCWCNQMTTSGIYWGNPRLDEYGAPPPACNGSGGAHPHLGDAPPIFIDNRPHEDEDYIAPNEPDE